MTSTAALASLAQTEYLRRLFKARRMIEARRAQLGQMEIMLAPWASLVIRAGGRLPYLRRADDVLHLIRDHEQLPMAEDPLKVWREFHPHDEAGARACLAAELSPKPRCRAALMTALRKAKDSHDEASITALTALLELVQRDPAPQARAA